VRVLSSESRTEGVAVSQANGGGFNVKLSAHRQKGGFSEHVSFVIDLLFLERNGSEVEQFLLLWSITLLLFLFLWFLALCFVLGSFFSS
jgi:hypothetical protein